MRLLPLLSPLVFLILVGLLGCQDSEISSLGPWSPRLDKPVCPSDHPSCKDDDGGGTPTSPDATVVISGGLSTGGPEEVQVGTDNQRSFVIIGNSGVGDGFEAAFKLSFTEASYPAACATTGGGEEGQISHNELAELLTDPNHGRSFTMRYFRRAQDQENSHIAITWTDPADAPVGSFDLWIGSTPTMDLLGAAAPAVVVSESAPDPLDCVDYTFSDGSVEVKHQFAKPSTHPRVVCPLAAADVVTITVCPV